MPMHMGASACGIQLYHIFISLPKKGYDNIYYNFSPCQFSYRNLVTFIGSLVFMIRLTWKLSAITLVGIPVITMVTHYFGNKFKVL